MVPAKVSTFLWQLQLDRVATKAGLLSRGFSLPDEGVCGLCVAELESSSHLFLYCKVIWQMWCEVIKREGNCWVMPQSVKDLLLLWPELKVKSDGVLWDMTPFALCWSVWVKRNDMVFNDKGFSAEAVWDMHIARITGWVKAWWHHCPYSASQFVMGIQHISMPKNKKGKSIADGDLAWFIGMVDDSSIWRI
ncbi:uncharacterized protein LOC130744842 [Lotus japonicus]|uniref:uncharacterized protein LOC130744842 n=1 Tax=Lotus japonicus TaxID=34305 RepID=UPI002582577E|nr:uncharacterized protein LOC130744842 [Lotus japonicus]